MDDWKLTVSEETLVLSLVKRHLEQYRPYLVARDVKWGLELSIRKYYTCDKHFVSLRPEGPSRGNVLLSYMTEGLLPGQALPNSHIRYWESLQMAKTFVELGYTVDVVHYLNRRFPTRRDYAVLVDVEDNLERLAPILDRECIKIFHITTAHLLFNNAAEYNRLMALQQRRGVTLAPVRIGMPNRGIEHADCATTCANEFTIGTFRYAKKPIYRLPVPSMVSYTWPPNKNFEASRKRFLWFASNGLAHKGLDLVLEAFAEMPEFHLTVCGPIEQEPAFVQAFRKELYHTRNIETIGWVDNGSAQFTEIANSCIGHVFASCAEGGGVCVIETMHAGLIPIVSYESSVDVHDFGVMLKNSSIEDIKEAVRTVADMPASELERRARKAWECARENHTREKFAQEYRRTIETILSTFR